MTIDEKKFVAVSYDLYVGGENGSNEELMEKATAEQPLTFVFGVGMMLEAFERNLKGLQVGDAFDFVLPCAEAYGNYSDEQIAELPKHIFEIEGKFDSEAIAVDKMIPMMTADGHRLEGLVVEVGDDFVRMDFNHPLAGEDLHFVGSVLEVRKSTEEELEKILSPCGCGHCHGDCEGGDCCDGESQGCGHCH